MAFSASLYRDRHAGHEALGGGDGDDGRAGLDAGDLALLVDRGDLGVAALPGQLVRGVRANSILPQGNDYTFWGKGISQGHSDAIRRIPGVRDAKQYTIPVPEALEAVRRGENPQLSTREKHTRECFVVLEDGADAAAVAEAIINMPNYFDEYDVTVNFISQEELNEQHSAMPHGGFVLRSGATASGNQHLIEYSLKLDSNPEFTSSVLVAYARAIARLAAAGKSGACTVFDVPPALLSPYQPDYLRAHFL